jgi:hypothetical protein
MSMWEEVESASTGAFKSCIKLSRSSASLPVTGGRWRASLLAELLVRERRRVKELLMV